VEQPGKDDAPVLPGPAEPKSAEEKERESKIVERALEELPEDSSMAVALKAQQIINKYPKHDELPREVTGVATGAEGEWLLARPTGQPATTKKPSTPKSTGAEPARHAMPKRKRLQGKLPEPSLPTYD
jgi:hypothetical protein